MYRMCRGVEGRRRDVRKNANNIHKQNNQQQQNGGRMKKRELMIYEMKNAISVSVDGKGRE
jgi:hypothetical protein